ncbi:MAG TPA: response regulator transcription factor [Candidatus Binatia bacterium]|nr:response regulator transcription factor [Candidatus Binatia bacterium]
MIQVVIADDHPVVRVGLKRIVADQPDMTVSAEAATSQELMECLGKVPCDVVLLDISMPGRGGLEALAELRRQHPKVAVLVLSVYPEEQYGPRVLRLGAAGYINKDAASDEIVHAIRKACAGGKYVSPKLAERIAADLSANARLPAHETLSQREFQVMRLIASGKTVSQIARELSLSKKTVSTHRARLLEKMRLKTNADLTFYAIQNELIDLSSTK